VAIRINTILVPVYHVWIILYDVNNIPREMCVKIKMKNRDAPFMCTIRISHPEFTSRIMWITERKDRLILGS